MQVHLVDGTYELFRAYYGAPGVTSPGGREVGATVALGRTLLRLVDDEAATHVAIAFDHVVESFRNGLFDGYKTGEGIEPQLWEQFEPAEEIARALGFVVWPMVEFEADDALAAGAARWADRFDVDRVNLCTPDKDLAQCVRGESVVMVDRRRRRVIDEAGVHEKFGVAPASIPDWLALVGDVSDGIPGVPRWGARSASTVLAEYGHLESIPNDIAEWTVKVRGAARLAANLEARRQEVQLYRTLATLRTDVPLNDTMEDLEWRGARRVELEALCVELGDGSLIDRVPQWRS
jgi:5'-3' exonuclease